MGNSLSDLLKEYLLELQKRIEQYETKVDDLYFDSAVDNLLQVKEELFNILEKTEELL